ncbi:energy transducer TonB [Mucilaginibacter panaciglaebae]|uniref:TonB C-terminal domain-containing protein n=1 Tax=Mucilaginibacter panaciglaebae TaxID=502331 RepID=A0ABP7WKV3_9SPHI
MKNLILFTFFSLSFFVAKAQTAETNQQDTTVYNHVDIQPEYPSGLKELTEYVKKNLKPGEDKGLVFTIFTVECDGSLTHIHIVKPLSETANKEAVRLISTFPKFKPGIKNGKVVRCYFTMPIRFPQDV